MAPRTQILRVSWAMMQTTQHANVTHEPRHVTHP
jgi:hypothetical protein